MPRVRLFHWRAGEAGPLIAALEKAGYAVDYDGDKPNTSFRKLAEGGYHAVVIDLSRLPSHGRYLAVDMRKAKSTRHLPVVFVDGDPEKVERIRRELPDALYTPLGKLAAALKKAKPLADPVTVEATLFSYAGRSVCQKMGIREGARVAVMNAPTGFPNFLGEIPGGVQFEYDAKETLPITLWFVHDPDEYLASLRAMRKLAAAKSKLWVVWPKAGSKKGAESGVTQTLVREAAIDAGLVDYKICSVSDVWSGMVFAVKK